MSLSNGTEDLLLIHNPRCSKSRQLEAELMNRGVNFRTRLYLKDPLDAGELRALFAALGLPPASCIRAKEAEYAASGLSPDSDADTVIEAVVRHPRLLERPVLVSGDRAAIGRPTENALALL